MENQSLEAAKSRKYKMEQLEKRLQESFNAMVKVAEEDTELPEVLSVCKKIQESNLLKPETVNFRKELIKFKDTLDAEEKYYLFYFIVIPYFHTCLEMSGKESDKQAKQFMNDSCRLAYFMNRQLGFGFFDGEVK